MAINKQKALDSAQKYLQKGQIDRAIVEFRKVCEADPEDLRSLQKLGDLCARQGSRQEAISTYMKLAEMLTARGFANRAVSIYKQILQLNPLLVPVYVKLSDLFKDLGLSKDARIFNQRAIEILQKTGNQDELLVLLKRIIEGDPEDAISRITLAETYLKLGDTSSAVRELRSVLPMLREQNLDELFIRAAERLLYHNPEDVELCRELAVLHMKRNEIPRAMKLLLFCRKKDPEDVEAMELLAYHFITTGMTSKATMVLGEKAKVHRKRGETDFMMQTYRKIVEVDPSDAEARRALNELVPAPPPAGAPSTEAEIPIFEDSDVQAVAPDQEAPPPAPTAPPVPVETIPPIVEVGDAVATRFLEEAEVFLKYGLVDRAIEHLRSGLEEAADGSEIHERLKDIYLDRGEMDRAEKELFLLAESLYERDRERAVLCLKEILLINPKQPRATSMLEALEAGLPLAAVHVDEEIEEIEELEEVEELEEGTVEEVVPLQGAPPAEDGGEYASFLDEETSDVLRPLPSLDEWSAEEVSESARALDAMTLPELELDDLAALDTETEEIEAPIGLGEPEPVQDLDMPETEVVAGGELDDLFPALDDAAPEPEPEPAEPPPPPPKPPAPPPASSTAVEEALEEADFFIQQGLVQEAVLFLEDLLAQYPGNRLIEDKLEELTRAPGEPVEEVSPLFKPDSLMTPEEEVVEELESESQITDEAFEALDAIESIIREETSDEDLGVGAQPTEIDASDAQTHYDLGVAYMEMEVWESAIQEFRIASSSTDMEALCYNMLGNCLVKQGRHEDAIKEYKLGLFAKKQSQAQELNLYYDIAEAYLKLDDQREAIYYLQNIKKKDPDFKDVKLKLIALSSSYKPTSRSSSAPPPDEKPASREQDSGAAAKEVDDAFDDLFGDFGKDE